MSSLDLAKDLCAFVDASPTPFHAVRTVAERLTGAGFSELCERSEWSLSAGDKRFVVRGGGTIIAFIVGADEPAGAGFRMIGAHTDSPNLRLKPRAETSKNGYRQVGVEPYGGLLQATWMDRDLGFAGRVTVRSAQGITSRLYDLGRTVVRIPNLAIHLNRGVNKDGLQLNEQRHLVPVCGLVPAGADDLPGLLSVVARELEVDPQDLLGFDLMLTDRQASAIGGIDDELIFAPRLDNLGSCHAALLALIRSMESETAHTRLLVLYDHEECGSRSAVGAQSTVLRDVLARIVMARTPQAPAAFERAIAHSFLVSADMAHAVHPNYADSHEPEHKPSLGAGLVIKSNSNQSYATNGETAAQFAAACLDAGYQPQHFVVRSDLPCGSTIGAITAARLGVSTVDVGAPMLSMHSCRELCGSKDVALAIAAYKNALSMSY